MNLCFIFAVVGALLSTLGLGHLFRQVALLDEQVFLVLNRQFARKPVIKVFIWLWCLGTTPVAIALLVLNFVNGWKVGSIGVLVYICASIAERAIKFIVKRPRPFRLFPEIIVLQPTKPVDASFPSGDTMRVWLLLLVIPVSFSVSLSFVLPLTIFLALFVSLGRIALGVHYPLDVVGGMGLGIMFAGINLYLIFGF